MDKKTHSTCGLLDPTLVSTNVAGPARHRAELKTHSAEPLARSIIRLDCRTLEVIVHMTIVHLLSDTRMSPDDDPRSGRFVLQTAAAFN